MTKTSDIPKTVTVALGKIKLNPSNPRTIRDDRFKKLVESIKNFPEMLRIRPIVVNEDMVILGGNMRLKACKEAGIKEVPIIIASNLSASQQREFVIKDNIGFGDWDWELLAKDWDSVELEDWGLEVPVFQDFSDKNQEVDPNEFSDMMTLKLEYTEEDYHRVKDALLKIAGTPEQAVFELLGLKDA